MNFSKIKNIQVPFNGVKKNVIKITDSNGNVLWEKNNTDGSTASS